MISGFSSLRHLACRRHEVIGASLSRLPSTIVRFSSGGDGGDGEGPKDPTTTSSSKIDEKDDKASSTQNDDDIFGVNYEDGEDRMGPVSEYPPEFKRDATTGLMTGEVENVMSEEDRKFLSADRSESESLVRNRMEQHWKAQGDHWASELGRRVREAEMGLNVLGRSPKAQATKQLPQDDMLKDGTKPIAAKPTGFSQRLTKEEFESFRQYMKKQHDEEIDPDDFPVMDGETPPDAWTGKNESKTSPDSPKLAVKWMTNYSRHQMDDLTKEDPYADIMPSDLNVHRLVNRKDAKLIPKTLLHHNNLSLLKSFLTPTSQIKHRMHSRLGAKDHRKVSKLIRRSRMMGLLPFTGQCSIEQQGWVNARDIHEEREWEAEVERRGLVVPYKDEKDKFEVFEEKIFKRKP